MPKRRIVLEEEKAEKKVSTTQLTQESWKDRELKAAFARGGIGVPRVKSSAGCVSA